MHTTEEQSVADDECEDDKEVTADEAGLRNRYEVIALTLRARRKLRSGIDVALEEMGDQLDYALNDMVQRGGKLQFIQFIEGRGMIVVADMAPPVSPFQALMGGAMVPVAMRPSPPPEEEELPALHPAFSRALSGWFSYVERSGLTKGSEKESKELGEFFERAFSTESAEELRKMIVSIDESMKYHVKHCDGEGCDTERFFKLAKEKLEGLLKVQLQ